MKHLNCISAMVLPFKVAISSISCNFWCLATFSAGIYLSHCNIYRMTVPKTNNYMQILILGAGSSYFSLLKDSQLASKQKKMPQNCIQFNMKTESHHTNYISPKYACYNISFSRHEPDAIALIHPHLLMWQFVDCHCYSHHCIHVKYKLRNN